MPKLWNNTIEAHRRAVRDATIDATAALVAEGGLRSVTMSQIAETTGIGRATLYKYFPDVESILLEWHGRQIASHLASLEAVRDRASGPGDQLRAVLAAYAQIRHGSRMHHDAELASFLHRDEEVRRAELRLRALLAELLTAAARSGDIRGDVPPEELGDFCLHALAAAGVVPTPAAVRRLVDVTLSALSWTAR